MTEFFLPASSRLLLIRSQYINLNSSVERRCMDAKERGRAGMHKTERVSNETIEYSIFSITYCTIARSTDEFKINIWSPLLIDYALCP